MSRSFKQKNNPKPAVNCEELQKEINGGKNKLPPSPVEPIKQVFNTYRIVGTAKPSKTGQSLAIKIGNEPEAKYYTILKDDIVRMFTDPNDLTVAYVREYDNPQTPKTVILRSNLNT